MPVTDEGPSQDDLERFSGETAFCPRCGEEVWDQAGTCPACGELLGGETSARHPIEGGLRRRWLVLVAVIVLMAFVLAILGRW